MFKKCSTCNVQWKSIDNFLADPNISLLGYQVHFEDLEAGWLMFNHKCGTTLAFSVATFSALYTGPLFTERKTGSEGCPEFCIKSENLDYCPEQCECAYVREVIQIIKNWPKNRI